MARTAGSDGKKTEARIRLKALELIARRGFEALTMRQLAGAAGLQAGALYHYFPDKQTLLFSLMERHYASLPLLPEGGGHEARLRGFARQHIVHHVAQRSASHVANNELRSLNRENFAAIMKMRGAYEKKLRAILADGQAAGVFDIADLTLSTVALLAALEEVCVWFREGGKLTLEEAAERYAEMALRMAARK
jgi:AcrR family transcriptional regulator